MPRFRPLGILVLSFGATLVAAPAVAAPVFVRPVFSFYQQFDYGELFIDTRPGGVAAFEHGYDDDENALIGPTGELHVFDGMLEATTGTYTGGTLEEYNFAGGGPFSLQLLIGVPGNPDHWGTFTGIMGPVRIEGDDADGLTEFTVIGRWDRATMALFGQPKGSVRAEVWYPLDFNEPDFGNPLREARTFGIIDFYDDVPEPALLTLLPIGLGFALRRRRRRIGRSKR